MSVQFSFGVMGGKVDFVGASGIFSVNISMLGLNFLCSELGVP